MRIRRLFMVGLLGLSAACAHTATAPRGQRIEAAEPIPKLEYPDAERRFLMMSPNDPERAALRDRLMASVLSQAQALADVGDYEGAVAQVSSLTTFLGPDDYASGNLPRDIEPLAQYIASEGGRLGDEGHVLGAYFILLHLTGDPIYRAKYDEVANWARESRAGLDSVSEQYAELIEVWSEHADLTPAPEVLDTLAGLYIEGRDAVSAETTEMRRRLGMIGERQLRLAPLNVAAVYLAHGEISTAVTKVESMGGSGELQLRLLELLRAAKSNDEVG
ncbi:MAG: hypothetical protein PVH21_17185, partial [Myxococcales bacterium]